jgi:hypothetical protein
MDLDHSIEDHQEDDIVSNSPKYNDKREESLEHE